MAKMSLKKLTILVLSISLVAGVVLAGCCAPAQTIEDITVQGAFTLIQDNQDNADFAIIDVRTREEFAEGHIENAINIDYYSETFEDELNILNKDKTYLVYCKVGGRSGNALDMMAELNFREAYNMSGGMDQWKTEGLPTIQETPAQTIEDITVQGAFTLIQDNQDNVDFVIIDVRTAEEFAEGHIENAIDIDYYSEAFSGWLNILNKDKTYLVYCRSGRRSRDALDIMAELNFREAYNMAGGIEQWKAEGLPTVE